MLPLQITLRDVPASPALEDHIRKKAEKLTRFYHRDINSCRVVVEQTQRHKHQGKLFNVKIDLIVPGKEFAVTKKQGEDVYIVLRDAFNALTRQIEEHSRKRQGRVKTHHGVTRGHIVRINPIENFGFIEGVDGHEYYFSMTNVCFPNFSQLTIGDMVEFMVEHVNDGRQAQHILRLKNHIAA